MPYPRPRFEPDEHDRSFAYRAMWAGLPASLGLMASLHFEPLTILAPLFIGVTAGSLIGLVFAWSSDEYIRAQTAFAANWALAYAGLALFIEMTPSFEAAALDNRWTLTIMATIFHVALALRRWRDG